MKVISGELGGQTIPGKSSAELRPTSDKVKEAIFDILQARWVENWADMNVLDLFAGTGAFGIECLSRGAQKATFVDHSVVTVKNLVKTLDGFNLENRSEVLCKGSMDAVRWLKQRGDAFDLIFVDPPYRQDWVAGTLTALQNHPVLTKKSLVIIEHDKREMISPNQGIWKNEGQRKYGDTMVSFLRPN